MEFVLYHLVRYGFVFQEQIQLMKEYQTPINVVRMPPTRRGWYLKSDLFKMSFCVQVLHVTHRKMKFVIRSKVFVIIIVRERVLRQHQQQRGGGSKEMSEVREGGLAERGRP
jgi:hypothetical protein